MIYFVAFLIFAAATGVSLRYNWWRIPQGWHKARVLMYHSVEEHKGDKFDKWRLKPADFEKQIAWLAKNGFKSFKLSELIALERLPKKAVCITFDDGFENNFTSAFEILKKYDFKASIFLVPDAVQNDWERANTAHLARMLSEEQILKICSLCELDCAQIYGRISADFKARLNAAGIEAWQVLSIGAEMPPLEGLNCDQILFDAKGASLGGNGVSFDWNLLRRAGLGYEGQYDAARDEKYYAGGTVQTRDGKKCDSASGHYDTQNNASSDEKCYAAGTAQGSDGARSYLKHSAICSGYSEGNLKRDTNGDCGNSCTEHNENGNLKLEIVSDVCCSSNSNEVSERAHDIVIRSGNTTQETSADRRAEKNDDECKFSACATARLSGVRPASEGVNDQGTRDYEVGAPNISNDGGEVDKLGATKDDSANKHDAAAKSGAISFILAGGIGAQNIREALALRPYAIDLNSRVEDARGIKDPKKISEILQILKNAQG